MRKLIFVLLIAIQGYGQQTNWMYWVSPNPFENPRIAALLIEDAELVSGHNNSMVNENNITVAWEMDLHKDRSQNRPGLLEIHRIVDTWDGENNLLYKLSIIIDKKEFPLNLEALSGDLGELTEKELEINNNISSLGLLEKGTNIIRLAFTNTPRDRALFDAMKAGNYMYIKIEDGLLGHEPGGVSTNEIKLIEPIVIKTSLKGLMFAEEVLNNEIY